MTTLLTKTRPVAAGREQSKPKDPYPLGWRDVPYKGPDGKLLWKRQALTLEDILHPQEEDFRMHNREHHDVCRYLTNVLSAQVSTDPQAVVLHDVRVSWSPATGIEAHGPDIALIFNVRQQKAWGTFDTAEEGTKPVLIIEVTSAATRKVDLVDKVKEYALVGVPFYAIIDIGKRGRGAIRQLMGYQLVGNSYQKVKLDERGWLWLGVVSLWLGWHGDQVACYDAAGQLLENYEALAAARTEAEKRAAAAEARLAELEAKLRRLNGDD